MPDVDESWFTKWLRNGRLSALSFLLVFGTWVSFQVLKIPAPLLDNLVLSFGGILVGNLALKKPTAKVAKEEKDVN